jgi:hypothetical protein
MTIGAFFLFLALLGAADAHAQDLNSNALQGDGSWKTDGEAKRAAQQWDIDLRRAKDGSVIGSINVADSPLLSNGRVEARFDGRFISGTIVDARGQYVARFNGLLSNGRLDGRRSDE